MTGEALEVAAIQERLRRFAAARHWERYHNPKNLATAVVVEAAELAEVFQWLTPAEALTVRDDSDLRDRVSDEVADVLIYLLRLADLTGINIPRAVNIKIDRNESRFPEPGP
jgi:NTP pyrophosphatase (non-canonical NTP hydrolase)